MTQDFLFDLPKSSDKNNPRILPLDFIYTLQMADTSCCLAVQAGLKYGINSAQFRICPYVGELSGRHRIIFIDNDYKNYDHQKHLSVVKKLRPKYATVRDIMTRDQCDQAGIKYYPLGEILDYAEEMSEHSESVIVIPKYECLDKIPDKFILGYSIPTSHGGTPMPPQIFAGRKVHLLGGSWKKQLNYLSVLGSDIISIDNNYIQLISKYARYVRPNGKINDLTGSGYGYLPNSRYAALALSFGAIAAKVNEINKGSSGKPAKRKIENG